MRALPQVPRKESNARLVRWSDGSLSLLLGEEMFDVVLSKQEQEYQYLVATHVEEGLFQTQTRFKEHMTFRPTGLNSAVHKKLTASIAAKHKKEAKTQLTEVDIDPEKAKELAEKVRCERTSESCAQLVLTRYSGGDGSPKSEA